METPPRGVKPGSGGEDLGASPGGLPGSPSPRGEDLEAFIDGLRETLRQDLKMLFSVRGCVDAKIKFDRSYIVIDVWGLRYPLNYRFTQGFTTYYVRYSKAVVETLTAFYTTAEGEEELLAKTVVVTLNMDLCYQDVRVNVDPLIEDVLRDLGVSYP